MYVTKELDMMSSMGLIHSRIRRVFYCQAMSDIGCLGSHHFIHDMRCLNHRFRVFHITPSTDDDQHQDTTNTSPCS